MSLYDQVCKLIRHPVFQMGLKEDGKGSEASGKKGDMKWIRVRQQWQNRTWKSRALCLLHKAVGVVTGLGRGGRNVNHAVSILLFSHRPTQNPRSEHTSKVRIWVIYDFLKLVSVLRMVIWDCVTLYVEEDWASFFFFFWHKQWPSTGLQWSQETK